MLQRMHIQVLFISFIGIAIATFPASAAPDKSTLLRFWEPVLSGTVSALSVSLMGTTLIESLDPEKNPMNSAEALCIYLKRGGAVALGSAAFVGISFWAATQQPRTSKIPDLVPLLARSAGTVFLGYAGAIAGAQLGTSWMCRPSPNSLAISNRLHILVVVSVIASIAGALGILLWR